MPQFDGIGRSEGGTGKLSKVGKSGHLNIFFYGTSLGLQHCYLKKTPLTQDNECVQELISTTHRRCSSILNHIARWPPPPRFTPRPAVSSRQMWGVRLRHSQIRVSGILIRGFGSRNLYKTLNGECSNNAYMTRGNRRLIILLISNLVESHACGAQVGHAFHHLHHLVALVLGNVLELEQPPPETGILAIHVG